MNNRSVKIVFIISLLFALPLLFVSCDNSTIANEVVEIELSEEEIIAMHKDFKKRPPFNIESIKFDTAVGKSHILIRLDSAEIREKNRQSKVPTDGINFYEEWLASGRLNDEERIEYKKNLEEEKQIVKSIHEGGKHLKLTKTIKRIEKRRKQLMPDSVSVTMALFKVNLQEKEGDPLKDVYFVKQEASYKDEDFVMPLGENYEKARSFLLSAGVY